MPQGIQKFKLLGYERLFTKRGLKTLERKTPWWNEIFHESGSVQKLLSRGPFRHEERIFLLLNSK